MKFDDQIRYYADRHNLMEGDAEFMIGLLKQALEEQRQKHADIAWTMQMQQFGGGTAIGNRIKEEPIL